MLAVTNVYAIDLASMLLVIVEKVRISKTMLSRAQTMTTMLLLSLALATNRFSPLPRPSRHPFPIVETADGFFSYRFHTVYFMKLRDFGWLNLHILRWHFVSFPSDLTSLYTWHTDESKNQSQHSYNEGKSSQKIQVVLEAHTHARSRIVSIYAAMIQAHSCDRLTYVNVKQCVARSVRCVASWHSIDKQTFTIYTTTTVRVCTHSAKYLCVCFRLDGWVCECEVIYQKYWVRSMTSVTNIVSMVHWTQTK